MTDHEILVEILAAVNLSPQAAFDALKNTRLTDGFELKTMWFECPECHFQLRIEATETMASADVRGRFTHGMCEAGRRHRAEQRRIEAQRDGAER